MSNPSILLCRGRVSHVRLRPFVHRFVYSVFCLRLRIDQPAALVRYGSWLFGVEQKRPVSFWARDHGARDGAPLMPWLERVLAQSGVQLAIGAVWLQCFPRVFGYVFNPVSFWLVHDQQGVLRVLLAEVNNTFGQRHQYVLTAANGEPITPDAVLLCQKLFHVSPFCAVQGQYAFSLTEHGERKRLAIDYFDTHEEPTPLLRTAIVVQPQAFDTGKLLAALLTMPLMTVGVIVRIHLQAFKLWRKGAKYRPVPPLPADEVSGTFKNHG